MDTTMRNRPPLAVVGAVAAVALAGVAALVALGPSRTADKPGATVAQAAPDSATRRPAESTCPSCGRVEAIRTVVVTGGPDGAKRTVYRVTVRMDDGSFRTLSQAAPPSVAVGEAVRISDGAVVRPPSEAPKG
jgi:hypothetical protein